VTETVWPTVEGTVILLVAGLDASTDLSNEKRLATTIIATTAAKRNRAKTTFTRR